MEISRIEKVAKGNPKPQKVVPQPKFDVLTRNKKRKSLRETASELKPTHHEQLAKMKEDEEEERARQDELYERWLHSPERTKKWRNKMAKMEKADAAKEQGALADIWVQCENPDCLKWRRISREQSTALDESAPWFCAMNPNVEYRECSSSQEDFLQVEREARRVGIKFIASSLPEGSLVWATMAGFCRWPALVTRDYSYGHHVFTDADDEPLSYHIEYLGQAHTHNWVSAQKVHLYGSVDEDRQLEAASSLPQKMKKTRRMAIYQHIGKKKSFWRKGVKCTVEGATREADELVSLSIAERLLSVVFTEATFLVPKESTNSEKSAVKSTKSRKRTSKARRGQAQIVPDLEQNSISLNGATTAASALKIEHQLKKKAPSKETCVRRKLPPLSPVAQSVTGEEVIQRQLHSQKAMVDCSNKEEKFTIDVQMYKKNEKAFEHDVRRFMIRQDRPITHLPEWKGIPISLFQLFLAVYDRGGYYQVVQNRQFEQIYREITVTNGNTGGTLVKKYYKRNLLPYEHYIKHEDYDYLFAETPPKLPKLTTSKSKKEKKHKGGGDSKDGQPQGVVSEHVSSVRVVPTTSTPEPCDSGSFVGLAEKELQEIDNMLSQLDSFNEDFFAESSPCKASSIGVTFFDENTPPPRSYKFMEANRACELGQASMPMEEAQTVPEMLEQEIDFLGL